jgi:predicted secreted hydrolase
MKFPAAHLPFLRHIPACARLLALGLASGAALAAQPATTADGFALPQPGHRFEFPRDHGSHPEFKIEWWYVTGHLFSDGGRRFGFQATFFRYAGPVTPGTAAGSGSDNIHLAHMAVIDVQSGKFLHQERLNRAGWNAASARDTLDVFNGNWSLRLVDAAANRFELVGGVRAETTFRLELSAAKPLVIFGENGVSRKGADATAASYYLTFTRLNANGELTVGAEKLHVTGEAWMDHEISSSQLSGGQVGWDWLSVQFNDHRELMLYRLRRSDGSADPASTLTWVDAAGRTQRADFKWEVLDRWRSPATGASYPSRILLTATDPLTSAQVKLTIEPLAKDQELTGSLGGIPYWEGACRVRDATGKEIGSAYLELTGYARDLKL